MTILKKLTAFALLILQLGTTLATATANETNHTYTITRTWDDKTHPNDAEIIVEFLLTEGKEAEGFTLRVEAPFYDDPKLPPNTPPGRYDGLWDYEVVEVFFLGPNEKYLEIELAPTSNFLVYYLEGIRNPTNKELLIDYSATISQDRESWKGTAFIPWEYLPPCVDKFNAYAIHIHQPGENRTYMSLFPVPTGSKPEPNFHLLEPFEDIDLTDLGLEPTDPKECTGGSSQMVALTGVILFANFCAFFLSTSS